MSNKSTNSAGLGFGTVLFLIFLVMKLAEVGSVANWSWWWITSPLWIPIPLVGIFVVLMVLFGRK